MLFKLISLIFISTGMISSGNGYKPVYILHGVVTGNTSMLTFAHRIRDLHPGTKVYVSDKFAGWSSFAPMWHQVLEIGADIMQLSAIHPEGIHLIGYSQGGLIARGILEYFFDHNVRTFVSLSSPQAGQYGTKFLKLLFPDLALETAFELFYSRIGQHCSIANYWNDPHHQQLYKQYSNFLPYINNELISKRSEHYRAGFVKLDNLVLIGGPDDGVITPWQSSHFGYFDENEEIVDMKYQRLYIEDWFGLRTINKQKKLKIFELSGVNHYGWHLNSTVIDKYIIPWLD